jgi:uncharacterized protein YuzB (UPF0349 family)
VFEAINDVLASWDKIQLKLSGVFMIKRISLFSLIGLVWSTSSHAAVCADNNKLDQFAKSVCTVLEKGQAEGPRNPEAIGKEFDRVSGIKLGETEHFEKDAEEKLVDIKKSAATYEADLNKMVAALKKDDNVKAGASEYALLADGGDSFDSSPGSFQYSAFEKLGLSQGQVRAIAKNPSQASLVRNYIWASARKLRGELDPDRARQYREKLNRNRESSKNKLMDKCDGKGSQLFVNYGMNTGGTGDRNYVNNGWGPKRGIVDAANVVNDWGVQAEDPGFVGRDAYGGSSTAGSFKTEAEAYQLLLALEKTDQIGLCNVHKEVEPAKNVGYRGPQMMRGYFGSGKIFKDNSADLNKSQTAGLDDMTAQLPKDQELKVKIYTCASMLRNCSQGADSGGDCKIIDQMRGENDEDILKSIEKDQRDGKTLSEDQKTLQKLFKEPGYQNALAEMKTSKFFTETDSKVKEQRLWLALSTLRGMKIRETLSAKDPKLTYELVPTGDPADPFNNSKIDPALSGTCGPLPANGGFYNPTDSTCDMKKQVGDLVNKRYEDPYVKERLAKARKKSASDSADGAADVYGMHRYASISVETNPAPSSKQISPTDPKVDVYTVKCAENADICTRSQKPPPHINIKWPSLRLGGGGGSGNGGGGRPDSRLGCYFD